MTDFMYVGLILLGLTIALICLARLGKKLSEMEAESNQMKTPTKEEAIEIARLLQADKETRQAIRHFLSVRNLEFGGIPTDRLEQLLAEYAKAELLKS